jgi:hypothetical protein
MKVSDPFYIVGQAVEVKVKQHGSLRAAARVLQITPAYLCRLRTGEKRDPSDAILKKLDIVREVRVTYAWRFPHKSN